MPKFQRLYNSSLSSLVISENHMLYKVFLIDFRNIKPFPERFFIENISFMKWDGYLKVLAYLRKSYGLEWKTERIVKVCEGPYYYAPCYLHLHTGIMRKIFKRRIYSIFWQDFCMKTETPRRQLSLQLFESECKTVRISILSTTIGGLNQEK